MIKASQTATWTWQGFRSGREWEGELVASWEVNLDPISDDYKPEDISAEDLFGLWVDQVNEYHPNQLIPILWLVTAKDMKPEFMPFQFQSFELRQDFLTFYTWPVAKGTGTPLNWLDLPVRDKLWNQCRANKGGFIQEFTGWKPAILQPYVYLPSLVQPRDSA